MTREADLHRQTCADAETIASLKASLRDLAERNSELERLFERNARHLDMMTRQLTARLAQQIDTRLAASRVQAEATEAAERQVAELVSALSAAQTEAAEQQVKLLRAEQELQDLANRLSEEAAQREALLGSTSWRITAPLRFIVRMVRGDR